jgi:hypothetical protein
MKKLTEEQVVKLRAVDPFGAALKPLPAPPVPKPAEDHLVKVLLEELKTVLHEHTVSAKQLSEVLSKLNTALVASATRKSDPVYDARFLDLAATLGTHLASMDRTTHQMALQLDGQLKTLAMALTRDKALPASWRMKLNRNEQGFTETVDIDVTKWETKS